MLTLHQNGETMTRWLSCEIERGLDMFAHRFSVRFVDSMLRTDDDDTLVFLRDIYMGAPFQAYWNDELILTGHIDRLTTRITGSEVTWTAEGRSLTGDLADCSATHETGTWSSKTATQIARDLCTPFGIDVIARASDTEKFPSFAIEEGETVHDAIDRLCKVRGLLPITNAEGNVELLRFLAELDPHDPGELQILPTLTTGIDLGRCYDRSYEQDNSNRYTHYLLHATQVDESSTTIRDYVGRRRPLVVIGDSAMTASQADTRARWERANRAGRSEKIRLTHLGALALDGKTFAPGTPLTISDTYLGVVLLDVVVSRSVLRVSDSEVVTELELCRPETYSLREYSERIATGLTKRGKHITHKTKAPKR